MDTAVLNAFIEVARLESFSQAANVLHLTQPAISKRIFLLEAELGVSLFDRVGRRISLTEAGRALLPRARQWLHDLDDLRRIASDLSSPHQGPLSGTLTVGTSHHIGLHRLPPALRRFSTEHPGVSLDIRFIDSEQAYDAVLSGELELGIVTLPPAPDARLIAKRIWIDPLAFVVASSHPLAQNQHPVSLHELASYPAILPSPSTFTRQIAEQLFQRSGLKLNVSMTTNYLETIKMMVSIGLGWGVLPASMCDHEINALVIHSASLSRDLGVVYHPRRALSRAATAMLTLLEAEIDA